MFDSSMRRARLDRGRSPLPSSFFLAVFGLSMLGVLWLLREPSIRRVQADREPVARGALHPQEANDVSVFKQCAPSVVHVTGIGQNYADIFGRRTREVELGTGSGFVWNDQGHIVTNYHVLRGGVREPRIGERVGMVSFGRDSTERFPAVLVGVARYKDLAVIQVDVDKSRLVPLKIGRSSDLLVGQSVLAIGNPYGLDQTLSTGVVSALGREIESVMRTPISNVIQTDAAINPGNSGGPLFDSEGRLIGVNTAIYSPSGASAGIGFAIPVDTVRRVVPDLIQFGMLKRPTLGIQTSERLDAEFNAAGVMVLSVEPGSGAEAAGLRATRSRGKDLVLGDLIVKVAGRPVANVAALESVLEDFETGQIIEVELRRDLQIVGYRRLRGRAETVKVRLGSAQ